MISVMELLNKVIMVMVILFTGLSRVYAQEVSPETLDSLYIRSLKSEVGLWLSAGCKYIEPTVQTQRIKNHFKSGVYKFPNPDELFRIAYRNHRHLDVYRLNYQAISRDTIDINVGKVSLHVKRGLFIFNGKFYFRKVDYLVSCAGTSGYQPGFRYVYQADKHAWTEIRHRY
jgi:hypothetical protein